MSLSILLTLVMVICTSFRSLTACVALRNNIVTRITLSNDYTDAKLVHIAAAVPPSSSTVC
jgi:hypothetical protein